MALKLPSLAKYYKTSGDGGSSGVEAKKAISRNRFQFTQPVPTANNRNGDSGELQSDTTTASPPQYPPVGTTFCSGDGNKTITDQHFNEAVPTVPTVPTEKVRDSQEQSLKTSPIAANDAQPGTRRPGGLPPTLLAASHALDAQIVAAGLSLTPPEQPKPKQSSVNKQVIKKVDTPTPKPSKVKHVDREWKPLATAYLEHHGHCAACIAAGVNPRYQRCGIGAMLWSLYQSAIQ